MSAEVWCGICNDEDHPISKWETVYCEKYGWELCFKHHEEYATKNPHKCTDRHGKIISDVKPNLIFDNWKNNLYSPISYSSDSNEDYDNGGLLGGRD